MKLSGNRIYSMKLFTKVVPLKNILMNESNWLNTLQIYTVGKSPLKISHTLGRTFKSHEFYRFLLQIKVDQLNFIFFTEKSKLVALGLLKTKVFWNKDYEVIISVHDVTIKMLSRNSNYIVDVVMWPKVGK